MRLWVEVGRGLGGCKRGRGKGKVWEYICQLEQDEQDREVTALLKMTSEAETRIPTLQR